MSPAMIAGTGILRGVVAGILLITFLAVWLWTYSAKRRSAFDEAAQLPLEDDVHDAGSNRGTAGRGGSI